MAKILSFEPRPQPGGRAHAAPDLPAIVVIFPGVRYERTGCLDLTDEAGRKGQEGDAPTGKVQ